MTSTRRPSTPTPADHLIALRAQCLDLLKTISEHVDSHFDVLPEDANWGHVGEATYLKEVLQGLSDRIKGEGEYAEV